MGWQWHQLDHMQIICCRQITTPAPHHSIFYRLDAHPDGQINSVKALKVCLCPMSLVYLASSSLLLLLCCNTVYVLIVSFSLCAMIGDRLEGSRALQQRRRDEGKICFHHRGVRHVWNLLWESHSSRYIRRHFVVFFDELQKNAYLILLLHVLHIRHLWYFMYFAMFIIARHLSLVLARYVWTSWLRNVGLG